MRTSISIFKHVFSRQGDTQYDRLSWQKWCNCKNCENMPTSSECLCCHEIQKATAFYLKGKARLCWSTAVWYFRQNLLKIM